MRLRLSTRLIVGVVLIEAALLTLLVWNSVRLINSSHAALLEQSTRQQTLLLANSLATGLAFDDRATLQDALSLLQNKKNLVYAAVYNRAGRLLASVGVPPAPGAQYHVDTSYKDALSDGVFDLKRVIEVSGQRLGELRVGYSISEVQQLTRTTRLQNTTIAALGLLVTVAATVLLGLLLTRNLRRLEAGAQALRRGELGHRIRIRSRDEIGDVADAFNQLAEHLEQTEAALQQEHGALEREKRHLDTLLNGIHAVVWEGDPTRSVFTYVSREAEELSGYSTDEWLQPGFCHRHVHPDDVEWVMEQYQHRAQHQGPLSLDYRIFAKDGRCIWIRDITTCEQDPDGGTIIRGLIMDITEEKAAEERILYLAEHDALTGLINRRRFQEELEQHIAYAQRYSHEGALLFIDLDQFKYINDSFGHQEGDRFLAQVAGRLGSSLRDTDLLGRLGGDEFGVLLPQTSQEDAVQVAGSLLNALSEKEVELFPGNRTHVSASIGVALFPTYGSTAGELLARADTAMYAAKEQGRNRYHVFNEEDQNMARVFAKIHWEERIRQALSNGGFVLHYQPVVDLASGRISHHEALLRMRSEDGTLIGPGTFLGIAERFGLIRDIDHWVLETAIRMQGESIRKGKPVRVAVNISGRHFGHTDVLNLLQRAIAEHRADPGSIIFEVTETAAVENLADARVFIEALQQVGCRFALDDFGIGFSSFYYLKNLPVDFIKIDGSFVRNMHKDPADAIFVKTISELAHGLGIITIAEFVEHAEVVQALRGLGVDMGQGYYLGKPAEAMIETLDPSIQLGD